MLLLIIFSFFACGLHAADGREIDESKIASLLKLSCSPPVAVPPSPKQDAVGRTYLPADAPQYLIDMHKNSVVKEVKRTAQKNHESQIIPIQKPKSSKTTIIDEVEELSEEELFDMEDYK